MPAALDYSRLEVEGPIVLQFSGGKDSLALLYLFKEHLGRITVLHCDTSDLLPEVQALVEAVERTAPRFVRVTSDAAKWISAHGIPSDLVPIRNHPGAANIYRGAAQAIVPLTDCCAANRWQPIERAIVDLNPALIIHGQRRSDLFAWDDARMNGVAAGGWKTWAPIAEWSDADVMAYLRERGAPILPWYSHRAHAPECATCPASWHEGRAAYLQKHHPELAARYASYLKIHAAETRPVLADFLSEWSDLGLGQKDGAARP